MDPINRHSLENYAERHRADFDLHEPRPELWAALEKQLHGESTATSDVPHMAIAAPDYTAQPAASLPLAPPVLRVQKNERWQRFGIAAALAALLVAAGLGEAWKTKHSPAVAAQATETAPSAADAALYLGPDNVLAASQGGADVDARLDTAVHGMERYYIAQLTDRKTQLGQLAPDATAEWARELVGLDSSYQQLKRELPRHPQPEVVLTAMNRNLQIRLDILDKQLELHAGDQANLAGTAGSNGEYVLADSRSLADNIVRRNGR
ncbi:hypothetical protein GCM10023172_19920 [Hymenobacter ginsengisoli]|uniref:Anti-sigma factor n=1 Tax=Hymenobacter ginsengisoli TaxID=1051626 RepID=A0ABP8QDS9_9BACT|nr:MULTISPECIES: hypothetical protein [unclassified Hymenobacter]MBO2031449.1 hypothetical protein [Hymenobacter sp. BT559]